METFCMLLALCEGNSLVTSEFPAQRPVTWSFDVLLWARINSWVNNRKAGDLRRHRTYYDVIVMIYMLLGAVTTKPNITQYWIYQSSAWPTCNAGLFTNDFPIVIQIQCKFHSVLIQVVMNWSLRILHMAWQLCDLIPYNGFTLKPIFH